MTQEFWIVFGVVFFLLAIFHFYQASKKIRAFENNAKLGSIMGVKVGLNEFIIEFNDYIGTMNKHNKWVNIMTAIGYLIASATCGFSYYLSLSS
jgi:uncharacterized membrane protein YidH (DUF202 family)